MPDLLHADYAAGFEQWHAFLHRGGSKPASANTPVAGKMPAEGSSGSLKSVDVEKNTITLTVGEKDQVYSVAQARLLRPDGQEVAGGLKSVQGFLDRQAVLATIKTEQKQGQDIVTEVRLQPRGK